jgi:hypothetical protein
MADKTAKQEASQALICAILDFYVGPETRDSNGVIKKLKGFDNISEIIKPKDNSDKKSGYDKLIKKIFGIKDNKPAPHDKIKKLIYDTMVKTSVDYDQIKDFLNQQHIWLLSSIYIANSLYKNLRSVPPNWKREIYTYDLIYARGGGNRDNENVMDLIEEIYKIINKKSTVKFSDINRWSPADIYFSRPDAAKKLTAFEKEINEDESLKNWTSFNKKISDLVKGGLLLPVSLKFVSNDNVIIKFFNVKNLNLKGGRTLADAKDIISNQYLNVPTKTGDKLIKFESFYDTIDCRIVPIRNIPKGYPVMYTDVNMQIRDKGGASTFEGWKPGVQGVLYVKPSEGLAGGVGGGTLYNLFGIESDERFNDRKLFKEIGGYILEHGEGKEKVALNEGVEMSQEAKDFLKKFYELHKWVRNNLEYVDFPEEAKDINFTPWKRANRHDSEAILLFYLDKRKHTLPDYIRKRIASKKKNKPQEAKKFEKNIKTDSTFRNEQYKLGIAQWFYSKYYTLIHSKKLLTMKKDKQKEVLNKLFLGAFSISENSSFFVKAG